MSKIYMTTFGRSFIAFAIVIVTPLCSAQLEAAIRTDFQTSSSSQTSFPISNQDLINAGQGSLLSHLASGYTASVIDSYGPISSLNDGDLGGDTGFVPSPGGVMDIDGTWSVVFELNVGLRPDGYAIGSIETITGHRDERKSQRFELFVSHVGDASFLSLGNFEFNYTTLNPGSTRLHIYSDNGIIASGVDAIRFDIKMPSSDNASVYREFDVFEATVPEPSSFTILGVGLSLAFGLQRIRRKRPMR